MTTDPTSPQNPPNAPTALEERLTEGMQRWAAGAPPTPAAPNGVDAVIRRSRRRTRRARLTSAIATVAVLGLVGVMAVRSAESASPGSDGNADDRSAGAGTGAADGPESLPNLELVSALQPFDSCDAFLSWVKTEARQRVGPYGFGGDNPYGYPYAYFAGQDTNFRNGAGGPRVTPGSGGSRSGEEASLDQFPQTAPTVPPTTASGNLDVADPDVSGTNVEEAGVDEPDIVKADANRVVTLLEGRLATFRIVDGAPRFAGAVRLPAATGNGASIYRLGPLQSQGEPRLLLDGNRALIVEQGYDPTPYPGSGGASATRDSSYWSAPYYQRDVTVVTQVDVGDLANPKLLDTVRVDGAYVDTRMVGGIARVVVSSNAPTKLGFVQPSVPGDAASEDAATAANQRIIDESTIEHWVPGYRRGSALTTEAVQSDPTPLLGCDQVRHPKQFSGFGMVSVLSIDVDGNIDPADATGVVATGNKVYGSTTSLYVSTVADTPAPVTPNDGPTGTTGTTAPDGNRLPLPPTAPPLPRAERTAIHAFDIGAPGPASYRASGEVEGLLLNDFAMSEHGGFLRTATHRQLVSDGFSTTSGVESIVSVLEPIDGELRTVGTVGGLGKGEDLKSVRFVGELGYVVTFRQVDPLYVIDLRDPRAPALAGELKMLGYSAYLHPVGDGRLLGIGQDATEQGRTTGTQIALYDVSDPANPTILSKATVPLASSNVEADYHAFLWWAKAGLAVVPTQVMGQDAFRGAIAYEVSPEALVEKARIVNPITYVWCPEGGRGCVVPGGVSCDETGLCRPPPDPIGDPVLRSLVVGDRLLTFSRGGFQTSDLTTITPVGFSPLPHLQ